jgi:predicted nucleic acid-binding protein
MKILIDTNVILDNILDRGEFADDAMRVIELCETNAVDGYMSASTVTDIIFIARKSIPNDLLYASLTDLFEVIDICSVTKSDIMSALHRNVRDFEDAVQDECAYGVGASYIVTRNLRDFTTSKVKAIAPGDFLKLIQVAFS